MAKAMPFPEIVEVIWNTLWPVNIIKWCQKHKETKLAESIYTLPVELYFDTAAAS